MICLIALGVALLPTGCGTSFAGVRAVGSLSPTITGLSSTAAADGSAALNLTIGGTNFTPGATANWNATPLTTTYVRATQLAAIVPASLVATAGTASVSVRTAAGTASVSASTTGGVSPEIELTVPSSPTISAISPTSATAGGAAFTLTINGANFTSDATANWGATALTTTYVSAAELTAAVPASLIATAGTANIMVANVDGNSLDATFTIKPPSPTISTISPTSATAGGAAFTLTINGTNFTSDATANWGATALTTTYVSTTRLTSAVPANLIASAGTASISVTNVNGSSSAATFTIKPPLPTISTISPMSATAGGAAFTLTVNGTNYQPGSLASVVRWNSTALTTTYVSSTQLTSAVPASLLGDPGTINIVVATAGGTSSSLPFTINPVLPVISSISPSMRRAGDDAFTLTIIGSNLTLPVTINWNGTPLVTTRLQSTMLSAAIPASLIATVGNASVTVTAAGGTSAPLTFTIVPPAPIITSLSPASAPAGGAQFTLIVNGTNFNSNTYIRWESTWPGTAYISPTQLKTIISASQIATAGTVSIVTYIPGGSGYSAAAFFTINPVPPTITSMSPSSVTEGYPGVTIAVTGKAFIPGVTAMWNTTPLEAVYISPTQLSISVPVSLLTSSGTASITVSTSVGTSAPFAYTIKTAAPEVNSLSTVFATAGGPAFTLAIGGNYFTSTTVVKWGSLSLATTYISSTELTAAVPASLITTAGTTTIAVSAAAGTSAAYTFTINPPIKIITVTLPSGTAGNAYSGPIYVTGGVPGYYWAVTGLPDYLTYGITFDNKLTITGTPTSSGSATFQVSVADTVGASAAPVTYTVNFGSGPNGANDGNLNGNYVCLFQGTFDNDGSRWAMLANFQADGHGNFSTGILDTNSTHIGSAAGTISGSYNIGSDNNGMASIYTALTSGAAGHQTTPWAVALTSATQPAQQFRMVEADDLGTLPTYQQGAANCYLATPSAFVASAISGQSFAFNFDGEDNNGNMKASVGFFSASNGVITSGSIDTAMGGSTTSQNLPFTGTYTAPAPATGRFAINLSGAGTSTGFTAYIIDANRMFIMDNTWDDGEQSGNMRTRQLSSYSGASLDGPFVFYLRGAEFSGNASGSTPSGYYADVFQGTGDGAGNLTINQSYVNDAGVYSAGSLNGGPAALTFDSVNPGRATLQLNSGTEFLYLFNTNSAFAMSVKNNGSVDSGWLEPQTQTTFTDAALAGDYLSGQLPLLSAEAVSMANAGVYELAASGAMTGATSTAGAEVLSWDQPVSATYNWDTTAPGTGTFLISGGTSQEAGCAVISPARFVCASQTDSSPSIEVMQQ
jgi:hypothetical protein